MSDEQDEAENIHKPEVKKKRKYVKRAKQDLGNEDRATPVPSAHKKKIIAHAVGNAVVTGRNYTVALQGRHADWLEKVAAMEGRTHANMLERLVRIAYSQDPYKGDQPQQIGSSFSGLAKDLKI